MADDVTEEQILEYAESVGYRRISRREYELIDGDAVDIGRRITLGQMQARAQEWFDAIDDESGDVHEPIETTAAQLRRFMDELLAVRIAPSPELMGGAAQGLVSQQGLILKEKELHSE